jgi:putative nucleotidyltransferase with HDIG domain
VGLEPPGWFLAHVSAVAEVASFLCERLEVAGVGIDRSLVEAAALLHDVDKLLDPADPLRELGHGHAGARWLTDHGYAELARPVAAHPISRLSGDDPRRWTAFASREERVVSYADKRAAQDLVTLAERFDGWVRRYPSNATALDVARPLAERLEQDVCRAAGVAPAEVRRDPWVEAALREARA